MRNSITEALAVFGLAAAFTLGGIGTAFAGETDTALAACKAAWVEKAGAANLGAINLVDASDAGRTIKVTLKARDLATGEVVKAKCKADAGTVVALDIAGPKTAIAAATPAQ